MNILEQIKSKAKALLYAINGGVDEVEKEVVVKGINAITDEYLEVATNKPFPSFPSLSANNC